MAKNKDFTFGYQILLKLANFNKFYNIFMKNLLILAIYKLKKELND